MVRSIVGFLPSFLVFWQALIDLFGADVGQGHESIASHQSWIALHPTVFRVGPGTISGLAFFEPFDDFAAPVVFLRFGIGEGIIAQKLESLAGSVQVVELSPVLAPFGHAWVFVEGVIVTEPFQGTLNAGVFFFYATIDEAFHPCIGHAAIAW